MESRAAGLTPQFVDYTPDHREAVEQFAATVSSADGVDAFGEQTLLNLTAHRATHILVESRSQVIGYAQLHRGSAELAVHPAHRRNGIGTALLREVKAHDPTARVWAHGNLKGAQELARRHDLRITRELVYMTAKLTPREIPPAPGGITVRPYTFDDAEDWLAVNAAAFAEHPEQGQLTMVDLQERVNQDWFDPEIFWLARDQDGSLAGYMWVKREGKKPRAEIYVLGVAPGAQGRGLGKFLTEYALAHMYARGVREMDLYVEGDNSPALATYAAYGFTRALTHVQYA